MRFLEKQAKAFKNWAYRGRMKVDWSHGGLGVKGRNLGFMEEPRFKKAVEFSETGNIEGWVNVGAVPKIRWRMHTCIWAAMNGMHLEGDFVECGVHTGLLSMAVCDYLDFEKVDKKFYLFDTFEGIPLERLEGAERAHSEELNKLYLDVFDIATRNFSRFPNAELVRGPLPGTLDNVEISKIAYLSMDLNSEKYEKETIELLWDKLVPGAMIVLDDYAFGGHEAQYKMWNEYAQSKGKIVYTLPSGQGLLQK
jgi:hypothetical protein